MNEGGAKVRFKPCEGCAGIVCALLFEVSVFREG